jgi:hypothetical protein
MALSPNRAQIDAIKISVSFSDYGTRTSRAETGGNFLLAAFDQATLAAIFAADKSTQPAHSDCMRVFVFPLLQQPAPSLLSQANKIALPASSPQSRMPHFCVSFAGREDYRAVIVGSNAVFKYSGPSNGRAI